mmetsp:Transcript_53628/g.62662  ORF Transcript_53628/g.62662 Transcript_53628/m.62662 type:complete len:106 (+) Transcript_53628:830-1147(+)
MKDLQAVLFAFKRVRSSDEHCQRNGYKSDPGILHNEAFGVQFLQPSSLSHVTAPCCTGIRTLQTIPRIVTKSTAGIVGQRIHNKSSLMKHILPPKKNERVHKYCG